MEEMYVWADVDVDTFEVLHVDMPSSQSSLNALLFPKEVLSQSAITTC
jgi:hypothetical protein